MKLSNQVTGGAGLGRDGTLTSNLNQTCRSIQLIVWYPKAHLAWKAGDHSTPQRHLRTGMNASQSINWEQGKAVNYRDPFVNGGLRLRSQVSSSWCSTSTA